MASSVPLKQLSIVLLSGAAIACIFISDASTSLSTVSPVVQSRTLQRIDNQLKASRIQTYPGTTLQLRTASSTTLNEVFGKEGKFQLSLLAPLLSTLGAAVAIFMWNKKTQEETAMFAATGEKLSDWYGPNRKLFLGPLSDGAPEHLKGELPGDYGFDVLGLATQPTRLERYRQGEIINGRWAMLGIVGCIVPELLARNYGVPFPEPVWFKTGATVFSEEGLNYLGNPSLIHAKSIAAILVTEILFVGAAEAFRVSGGPLGPATDLVYPGKAFDPLGLANDETAFAELKVKEVKNGRLAMLGMLGLFMQGFATSKGPLENLADHLADPTGANIITFHQRVLSDLGGVAMF